MPYFVTYFGDSSSGLGALGVDARAFIIQIITFILAFLVLKRFAFKPILKVLNERRETIEKGVDLGVQMQKEKEELDQKISEMLHDAREQADAILATAHSDSTLVISGAEEVARKKADILINDAEVRIKQDMARAWKGLEKDLAGLVSEATEAIIEEKVDTKKDSALIDKALKSRSSS